MDMIWIAVLLVIVVAQRAELIKKRDWRPVPRITAINPARQRKNLRNQIGKWADDSSLTRCNDADRAAVSDILRDGYSAGSLDNEEFRRRNDAAMTAVHRRSLARLIFDLPEETSE